MPWMKEAERGFQHREIFFPVRAVTVSEAQRQDKGLQWRSCTELKLLCSVPVVVLSCLPHPSQLSPVTLGNSASHSDWLSGLFEAIA